MRAEEIWAVSKAIEILSGGAVDGAALLVALAAQQLPEVVGDVAATAFEVQSGLPVVEYLRTQLDWRVAAPKAATIMGCVFCTLMTARIAPTP